MKAYIEITGNMSFLFFSNPGAFIVSIHFSVRIVGFLRLFCLWLAFPIGSMYIMKIRIIMNSYSYSIIWILKYWLFTTGFLLD